MTIKIVYTSATGNTKTAVELLSDDLEALGQNVEAIDAEDGVEVDEFFSDADAYVIASWSDGDNGEVPGGIIDFYDDLDGYDLSGAKVAVIGTGDSTYPQFCAAVDLFEKLARTDGAEIIGPSVKIELNPDDEAEAALKQLAETLADAAK
ncbi:MAG: flavodoxin domain-containing protein [Bifidobacterium tibiigranuli]|jgi:flavodoxin I|uniref:flavodoxin domain-containing protein n=1 Tax=Bifidobacterium tibiigranuli TaxID=2172043 RepID=UPI0023547018|nr:flavodoxin domain-containing protein [Bifidobacterium tibiigranuli]MCH3975851.1 flavodoxin domain-containing protein [Bifidobacterium tibiigranuli]MCH4190109.1 flavodoxin domain-containing protein [Bifidobacterium tibiigranuli]MCH4203136.1 flavodoxin domain-containing protein [Bifidobacterium tibiigranuli]MCH4274715.1 flavodoxin domain-containing protein [Bifidobacterium tibiigranuli]